MCHVGAGACVISAGAGVIGTGEGSDVHVGIQTPILWKSSACS